MSRCAIGSWGGGTRPSMGCYVKLRPTRRRRPGLGRARHSSCWLRSGSLLDPGDRRALEALPPAELWRLEQRRDVDLDAIYGKGTVELRGRMHALLILKLTFGGRGFAVRDVTRPVAMADLPLFQKDLGMFDSGRSVRRLDAPDHLAQYAALLDRVRVIEVTGGVDFSALVDVVG